MKKGIIALAFVILLFLQLASAEIILSQPKQMYSLGDTLKTEIKITGNIEGILETSLVCDNEKQLFYAEYLSLKENEQKILNKELKLKDKKGNCYIEAKINNEEAKTSFFTISSNILISFSLNKETLTPNDTLEISGKAVKENNENFDGILETYIDNVFLKATEIKNSKFSEKISLPNINSYNPKLVIKAKDNENLNFGEAEKSLVILSIPSLLKIETNEPKAGSLLEIAVFLYDQNNKTLEKNISIIVDSPEKPELYSKEILSGKKTNFELPDNAPIGNWKISAVYENTEEKQNFYLDKNEKIIFSVEDGILKVKNIGNALYKKVLVIEIANDNSKLVKEVFIDLAINEEQKLKLSAPDGEYDIKVQDKQFSKVSLTGNAINIEKLSNSFLKNNPLYGIIILITIIAVLVLFSHGSLSFKLSKVGNVFKKEAEEKKVITTKLGKSEEEKAKIKSLFEKYVDKDVANLAISGKLKHGMHNATFLFTDIRGYSKLSENPEKALEILNDYFKIITDAVHLYGGAVSQFEGDAVEAMFNITREQPEHVLKASYTAIKIKKDIENYNKTKNTELKSGTGIDTGKVYLASVGSKLQRYQPIGNAVNIAAYLSQKSSNQIFITPRVYEKIKDAIKTKKFGQLTLKNGVIEVYEITK